MTVNRRLLIVSNRLPVTVKVEHGEPSLTRSAGGLATGLSGPHERSDGLWIGWPGDVTRLDGAQRASLDTQLAALRTVPIHLSASEVSRYYDGFANGVLWPLFHYQLDLIPHDNRGWIAYRAVNERFADAIVANYRPGDLIWIHDYQLMLVPGLVRERIPDATIGFFLHIPFPSTEILRTLPWRKEILIGLLGADLIGFHTFAYQRHFANALLRFMGLEPAVDHVDYEGRDVRLGVFPMGVDAAEIGEMARDPEVIREAQEIRDQHPNQKLVLGIDRLDYTKGIPRRLLAIERLLERDPTWRGRIRFIQIAVPSREHVRAYEELRRLVEETVGHINGAYGTTTYAPIRYIYRGHSARQVTTFYKAADAMLVTPLRDGMNLVAKEFIASRDDEDGVLVLSELAGAAAELGDAIHVNPYDIDQVADSIAQALTMEEGERRSRMRGLRNRVKAFDVHEWASAFVNELASGRSPGPVPVKSQPGMAQLTLRFLDEARRREELVLLLDYDGTLVPTMARPELARPDEEILALLRGLAARPRTRVHLVTGRARVEIEQWFGDLPISLHAEHGAWSRTSKETPWLVVAGLSREPREQALRILMQFAARTPGAFVEEKEQAVAWHYRAAEPEFGALQATELRLHLAGVFSNVPVEVIAGDKVVEVRPQGANKGLVARRAVAEAHVGACVLCIGNDRTDEDMFEALAEPAFTVKVGPGRSAARYRLPSSGSARELLRALLV